MFSANHAKLGANDISHLFALIVGADDELCGVLQVRERSCKIEFLQDAELQPTYNQIPIHSEHLDDYSRKICNRDFMDLSMPLNDLKV